MNVEISRESGIPLHLQVERQIALQIATGNLKPGDSLPSIRALAKRLKIHYNTVSDAYKILAGYRMVERHRGNRMMVSLPKQLSGPNAIRDLDDIINAAIQLAVDHGYPLRRLCQTIQERLLAQPPDHFLVVAEEAGIRELLRVEIAERFERPVASCSIEDLSLDRTLAIGALVVSGMRCMQEILPMLTKAMRSYSVTMNTAESQVEMVRKLKQPSAIAAVSVSEIFLQTARGVLAPALGHRHTLREYLIPSEKPRNLDAFGIVFCDSITRLTIKAKNLIHHQLISPKSFADLASAVRPR
jgi:DNA-binding transcriptional regulator YhcF (GntR family)